MSLIVEALSSGLGAARADVHAFLDALEARIDAVRGDLSRRIGNALGGDGSNETRADAVVAVAGDVADEGLKRLVLKLIGSVAGAAYGAGLVSASLSAGTGLVAIGVGIELAPIIAAVLGIALIWYCGSMAFGVIRTLMQRLDSAVASTN